MAHPTMKLYPRSQSADRQTIRDQEKIPLDLATLMRGLIMRPVRGRLLNTVRSDDSMSASHREVGLWHGVGSGRSS
jgi:hypothetical protein